MLPLRVAVKDVAMTDPTLMRRDGLHWVSYTNTDVGAHGNLRLMLAESLTGPWRKHPGNPVKIDIRSSRPGSTPSHVDSRRYRPAQDRLRAYGGALVINAVRTCTREQ